MGEENYDDSGREDEE